MKYTLQKPFFVLLPVLALGLLPVRPSHASTVREREKAGKVRLDRDLAEARRLARPPGLAGTPLPDTSADPVDSVVQRLLQQGRPLQALRLQYEIIDRGAGDGWRWAADHLGRTLWQAGLTPYAIIELQKRSDPTSRVQLARCLLEYDQFAEASRLLDSVIPQENPGETSDAGGALWAMADLHRRAGDAASAAAFYRRAHRAYDAAARHSETPEAARTGYSGVATLMNGMEELSTAASSSRACPDGAYSMAVDFVGPISVKVTVSGGRITRVQASGPNEPPSPLEIVSERIVRADSPSVDPVTGFPLTSEAVMYAVHRALARAPGAPAYADGAYLGRAGGYVRDIVVRVTVAGGRIASVRIVSEREDRPRTALTRVPASIVHKQLPDVDAVAGATVTSCAVMEAVKDALSKARPR
ncbi:MAG: FMN-binding protein [Planctomycetes bacterium]|nr:FMN-binding protein [Planctomycetota bacterium]